MVLFVWKHKKQKSRNSADIKQVSRQTKAYQHLFTTRYFASLSYLLRIRPYTLQDTGLYLIR